MQSLTSKSSLKSRSKSRSIRKRFCEENVYSASNALEIIFPHGTTRTASLLFAKFLNEKGGCATKSAVSNFADTLNKGMILLNGQNFSYSRRNFYLTVLKTLLDLGFVQRNSPVWNERYRKTLYVYERNIFDIPAKPPSVGFWRLAYYICRKWNDLFSEGSEIYYQNI